MKTLLKLAWRNLWRNRKRTLITMASIFLTVFLALFMRSMQNGFYDVMISNSVRFSTGYLQIQNSEYWEDKTINNTVSIPDSIVSKVNNIEEVTLALKRIESFALASTGEHTKGIMVVGANPRQQNQLINLEDHIIDGYFLSGESDKGVIIAKDLAAFLNVHAGDSVVLLGQGYHGITAAGQFPVRGIINYPLPNLNNTLIMMSLTNAQYFYGLGNNVTSLSIMIDDQRNIEKVRSEIASLVDDQYALMSWDEMSKELVQVIESDNAGGIIMLGVLYMIVGFGVLGTMMMMVLERKKELAVMVAVGLQKAKLNIIILFETIFIGLLAIITGSLAALPVLLYFHSNPIPVGGEAGESFAQYGVDPELPFAINPDMFFNQAIVTVIITLIAVIYPLMIIKKLQPVKAMRS